MLCRRLPPIVWAAAFCCSLVAAQTAAPAPPAPAAAPAQAVPVIRTTANLVLVDVVVTDKGKPVQGLTARQFHVLEDGTEQRITIFEEHRASDAAQAGNTAALPANVYSNYPRFAVTSAANVLLLDALNTPLSDQSYVRKQMVEYLRGLPAGTRVAVFTLASRLRMIAGFTTDAGSLDAAITHGKGNPQQSSVLESPEDEDELNDVVSSMSTVDGGAMEQFLADTESFQTDLRVRITLDAMQQLGRYLSTIPGRKNLIWFSGSFPLQIEPDTTLDRPQGGSAKPASPPDSFSALRNYSDEVKQTDDLLSAARVAVYPVDARGLMGLASVDAQRGFTTSQGMPSVSSPGSGRRRGGTSSTGGGSGSHMTPAQKADAKFLAQTINEHQTMDQIAEETGGEAFYDNNGLKDAVAKAIENGSNYFTIGYIPDVKAWDGTFHAIEVRVDGGKYGLGYRRGYYAVDPAQAGAETPGAVSPMVAALQRGAPPLSQIVFEARVLSADDPAAKAVKVAAGPAGEMAQTLKAPVRRYLVDFAIDPHAIAWTALPNSGAHADIEVAMVAWDADGKRLNYTDHAFAANLDPAESKKALSSGLPLHQEIDLPAGTIYLRVAVRDRASGRIGSMEIPLRVPKT